ncbi:MAG: hypothetical protein HY824_10030 [Acidobacteria bacterium]|nr:hypothetical protein [Acidobacteriota bacterium]
MQKRTVRITVLTLLLAATLITTFFLWNIQQLGTALTSADEDRAARLERVSDALAGIGTAQQSYVAPGQLDEPWFERIDALLAQLRGDVSTLPPLLRSQEAASAWSLLNGSLDALAAAEKRARANVSRGQELMAADVIFSDGRHVLDGMTEQVRAVQRAERAATRDERASLDRERWMVLGLAMLVWLGVAGLAGRTAQAAPELPDERPAPRTERPAMDLFPVDLVAAAALCTDLSRVGDTAALAALLGRAASLLDAPGVTLWLGAGDQLFAVLGHGYSREALARFGPLARDADNAVARAWQTGRQATVAGTSVTPGALVTPLFGTTGCIGVLALECRARAEADATVQAVAAMVAAQVATAVAAWPAAGVPVAVASEPEARTA